MKTKTKRYEFEFEKVQPGDVIVSATRNTVIVDRPLKDTYDDGTALQIVDSVGDPVVLFKMSAGGMSEIGARSEQEWLALYDDGSLGPVEFDMFAEEIEDSKKTVEAPKPPITRGLFIDTLEKTVADNDLNVGTDFLRAIVFASDRLGLR